MTTTIFIGVGLVLALILVGILAWKKTRDNAAAERWQRAYAAKLAKAHALQVAARARDQHRAAELKAEIARLRKNKKRFLHLQADLHALTSRHALWERGA